MQQNIGKYVYVWQTQKKYGKISAVYIFLGIE